MGNTCRVKQSGYSVIELPRIGFGTWQILMNRNAQRAVSEALEIGYRLIDTAMIYGNEKGVGAAIRSSNIPRHQLTITTKLWNRDQGYEKALTAFNTSLKRLGLSYIDLYLIHWPRNNDLTKDTWRALEEIAGLGLAKNLGVSNFTIGHLEELHKTAHTKPVVNQIEFHPFIYEQQKPILKYCKEHGIVVEAYSPLGRGNALHHETVVKIANNMGKTPGQVLLRWAIQQGTVPIPKTAQKYRMKENFTVFDFELSKRQMMELNNLSSNTSFLTGGVA